MIRPRLGIGRTRRLPAIYIFENAYSPFTAIWKLTKFRWIDTVAEDRNRVQLRADGQLLNLSPYHASTIIDEWEDWEKFYLPPFPLQGKTILDVGAGCGETAFFYFRHGVSRVIAVEPSRTAIDMLRENAGANRWNIEIHEGPFRINHLNLTYDFMKMDCEGCEEDLLSVPKVTTPSVVEVHDLHLLPELKKRGLANELSRMKGGGILVSNTGDRSC